MKVKSHNMGAKYFNKILLIIVGAIVAIALVLSVVLVIVLDKTSKETSKNKYISMNNNKKIEALVKLKDDVKDIQEEKDRVETYLPEDKDISGLLKDIEGMAVKNGLSFTAYQLGSEKSGTSSTTKDKTEDIQLQKIDDYYAIPFQVDIGGSFTKINDMIRNIESHSRLVEIKSVSYKNPSDAVVGSDTTSAHLLVNAYLKK